MDMYLLLCNLIQRSRIETETTILHSSIAKKRNIAGLEYRAVYISGSNNCSVRCSLCFET